MDVSLASIKGYQLGETGHCGDPSNHGFSMIPCGSGKVVETSWRGLPVGSRFPTVAASAECQQHAEGESQGV